MGCPNKERSRRSMMFLNAQGPSLIKDSYFYDADSLMSGLEDAVTVTAENIARFLFCQTPKNVDYRGCERVVRTNGLDTEYWEEDIRCCIVGGADVLRIPGTEDAEMVEAVKDIVPVVEREFERPGGSTLLMTALESAKSVMSAYEVYTSPEHMAGIALSGGDYTKDPQTKATGTDVKPMGVCQQTTIAARATGAQCFDTAQTDLGNLEDFRKEVMLIEDIGFDGRSAISPCQIPIVHKVFTPSMKEITFSEKVIHEIDFKRKGGINVFTVDDKMISIALYDGAQRVITLAEASGVYKGEL